MGYTQITVQVADQALRVTDAPTLTTGGVKEVQVSFSFCDLWTGAAKKTAVFYRDEDAVYHVDLEDDACVAPWEVFTTEGTVFMGVFAEYANGTVRTSEIRSLFVYQGAITEERAPTQAPDIYSALASRVAVLEDKVANGSTGGTGGGVEFKTDASLTLKDGVLSVNTTNQMEQDNTLPMTSAGVYAAVGNIEALLKTI
jgi:hypothetical protein